MLRQNSFVNKALGHLWVVYLIAFVAFLLIHIVMFRDVVANIPAIVQGNTAIVREELVPFFDFGTQFWGENSSALTNSEEVRTGYSFWTAWVRYAPILPFALILLNTLSAFLLFFAFHCVGRYFSKERPYLGVLAAFLAALVIHGILLYAKIAHFYVLIIGFSLFAVSVSLVLEQVFFKKALQWRNMLAVVLTVLINPAVHYHVMFYLLLAVILLVFGAFVWVMNRPYFGYYLKKHIIYFLVVTVASLVPYALVILSTTSTSLSSVATDIPVNYWLIFYSSLALPFVFTFDTAGHLDLLRYGNYLAPLPRLGSLIITFLVASLFLFKQWATISLLRRVLLASLFLILLVSMWMSIGYSPSGVFSFHAGLSWLATFLADQTNAVADFIGRGLAIFINILRFPHRFQFIYFYVGGLLLMIALVWLHDALNRKFGKRILAVGAVILIALFPLYGSGDYRSAILSGDFATFATPYKVPGDLAHIKDMLGKHKDTKLFILPTLESGRELVSDNKRYSFLDKFFIYYLNEPTLYYGVGASTQNKILAYVVYRALELKEPWWQDMLINNLGVTHLLVPKHLEPRHIGLTYLPNIEKKAAEAIAKSTRFKNVYEGSEFALYKAVQPSKGNPLLIDLQWEQFLAYMKVADLGDQAFAVPLQLHKVVSHQSSSVYTDSPERTFYNIYASINKGATHYPDTALLPFSKDLVASSNFTNNALSLSTLYNVEDQYNYLKEIVPGLANLRSPQFIGLTKGVGRLDVPFTVATDGTYRLALHAGSRANEITAHLGGQRVVLQKIASDKAPKDHVDFTYFYADLPLIAGKHVLEVQNATENAVLTESLTLVPQNDVPKDFTNADNNGFSLRPAQQESMLLIDIKGEGL